MSVEHAMNLDEWIESQDGRFRACFTYIGEGWHGDYDPEDPTDSPLLRFDVQTSDPEWVRCDDASIDAGWYWVDSYCTQVRANVVTGEQAETLLRSIVGRLNGETGSVKKILEELSWISEN